MADLETLRKYIELLMSTARMLAAGNKIRMVLGLCYHGRVETLSKQNLKLTDRSSDHGSPPFLRGLGRRIYAAIFSFCADVIPPLPMLGRSGL